MIKHLAFRGFFVSSACCCRVLLAQATTAALLAHPSASFVCEVLRSLRKKTDGKLVLAVATLMTAEHSGAGKVLVDALRAGLLPLG